MSAEEHQQQEFDLEAYLRELPEQPGVYQYLDEEGKLIYVGKAKNLKKRVNSYFQKKHYDRKTARLVSQVKSMRYTIVDNELDALLLENNLIKKNQPRYNINLKDDKSYPFVCVTNEPFPKIYPTRRPEFGVHEYFGPYASVGLMHSILDLIRELFPIRTCNLDLSAEKIAEKKYKVCLEYHIFNCKGPCEGHQHEDEYLKYIRSAKNILKGNLRPAKNHFKEQMEYHAERMEFEEAQKAKTKLERIEHYQAKSLIINPTLDNILVAAFSENEGYWFVNSMLIRNGYITSSENYHFKKSAYQNQQDILDRLLSAKIETVQNPIKQVITNVETEHEYEQIQITVPKIGDKKKLLTLSQKNCLSYKQDIMLSKQNSAEKSAAKRIRPLVTLQQDLKLKKIPRHIECFDNSNMQGSNPVASMVCFRNGQPYKNDYRRFSIKTVEGPDDFASMKEIVSRRYTRFIDEQEGLPDLVIIDGGKGQLSAAVEAMREIGVYGQIPIIGIAKKLEEIYFPEDPVPLHIDKKSESLKLIQRLRNEAHRFAITYHRGKRSKGAIANTWEDIPGIGPKTVMDLRKNFKSLKKAKEASEEKLAEVIGKAKARIIVEHFTQAAENENA